MSQIRFLADHDLNEHIIDGVVRREPAIEFVRARDVGYGDRPDADVLEYANGEGLLVVSHDVNTMPAAASMRLRANQPISGLLMIRQTLPLGPVIEDLLVIWTASDAEEWRNLIRFLPL